MAFEIHFKNDIANQINIIKNIDAKNITVSTLNITDGLLKKGNYYIPVENILFIEEI